MLCYRSLADIIADFDVNIAALPLHSVNLAHTDIRNGFRHMFQGGEAEIRTQIGHNVHEYVAQTQGGGTSMLFYDSMIEQYDYEHSGKDDTGLGRWTYTTMSESGDITTMIVCGHMPNYVKKQSSNSSYQRHRIFLVKKI